MEKLKLSLLQKWVLPKKYSFVHSSAFLSDGRAVVLTSNLEACDQYCALILSTSEIREIVIDDCSDERRNYPVLFCFEAGFGIIKKGKQVACYMGDFSSPEVIEIKNTIVPQKAQQRYFQVVSDGALIPVCFENEVYYGDARYFALLEVDVAKKYAKWRSFSSIDKKAFTNHEDGSSNMPKIDSLKLSNQECYVFISGESTTSVNKWGMDYYALAKISADGKVLEILLESDDLKRDGKKGGVNGYFTDSEYVILKPLFKNGDWKGKQKLFSLTTGEYFDLAFPRGMSKHQVQNISGEMYLTFLYDRGLKEIALCNVNDRG